MDSGRVSMRYARAIYEFARDNKEENRLYEEMKTLIHSYSLFPSMTKIMEDPTIQAEVKKKTLTIAAGITVSDSFGKALDLILKRKREKYLLFISLMYQDYYRKKKGIVSGQLLTTEPVNIETQDRLKELIRKTSQKEPDFVNLTDSSIIGGFVLELDFNLLDASIRGQLNRIKSELYK